MKRATILLLTLLSAAAFAAPTMQTYTGMVTALMDTMPGKQTFVLQSDAKTRHMVIAFVDAPPRPGDLITLTGKPLPDNASILSASAFSVTGHRSPPAAENATPAQIASGEKNLHAVRLNGIVDDAFVDEIDNRWYYFVLRTNRDYVYVTMHVSAAAEEDVKRLIDSEIELTGVASDASSGRRRLLGAIVHVHSFGDIRMINASPDNPFDRPELTADETRASPDELRDIGRKSAVGDVLAVWGGDHLLLRRDDGSVLIVELARGTTPPVCGDRVQTVGLVETDFYRINLSNARIRTLGKAHSPAASPLDVKPEDILQDKNGNPRIWTEYFGRAIRLVGIVRSLPSPGTDGGRFYLESGRFLVPVDVSANPEAVANVPVGARLAVSGVCLLETENWRPRAPFPRIRGMVAIVRNPSDIVILSQPPWWTPKRLLMALASFLAALIGFGVWNRFLQHTVERRSRQLLKSEIAKVASDLRVDERTRLAVELHDSVTQMLTGVSMQLDASIRARDAGDSASADKHLVTAQRTLKSCLTELRRCLWDLRNEALEEPDFTDAVRKTLAPSIEGATLQIRMAGLKRSRLSDATAHALLRIIRELAVNAVRHGRATKLKVAAAMENGTLLVSVRDNGTGFDPSTCPGPGDGHFGLDGIRERIRQLGGTFEITSAPGRGTMAKIILNAK